MSRKRKVGGAAAQHPEREIPSNESDRVEMFTDGVFAIAITLLVLDLPVPSSGSLPDVLMEKWPSFVAYLAAFLTIAGIWVHHHTVFERVARVEPAIVLLNLLLLLGVSLLPWPTALVAESIQNEAAHWNGIVACGLFALAALVVMISWSAMTALLSRRPHLLRRPHDAVWMRRSSIEAAVAGIPVLIAFATSFVNPVISLALYGAIPVYFLFSTSRRRPRSPVGPSGSGIHD
ncbi:TMEM175 family protein [Microbacterium sp. LWS13-1.2]|uniref:TMEM175 family protein n=1 Tax=Microbacterium sp. LWS13-1.2 TaxID=3135264 RepID=UPI0032DB902C